MSVSLVLKTACAHQRDSPDQKSQDPRWTDDQRRGGMRHISEDAIFLRAEAQMFPTCDSTLLKPVPPTLPPLKYYLRKTHII